MGGIWSYLFPPTRADVEKLKADLQEEVLSLDRYRLPFLYLFTYGGLAFCFIGTLNLFLKGIGQYPLGEEVASGYLFWGVLLQLLGFIYRGQMLATLQCLLDQFHSILPNYMDTSCVSTPSIDGAEVGLWFFNVLILSIMYFFMPGFSILSLLLSVVLLVVNVALFKINSQNCTGFKTPCYICIKSLDAVLEASEDAELGLVGMKRERKEKMKMGGI